ncbi:protein of unknown function [Streptantibioticus cattleyicolor NRRL 8057 = DSM 46488]|nr:protein of unknown function [Streptantibioticus cattleyicolor NRRL 8057 = DSM 46488]
MDRLPPVRRAAVRRPPPGGRAGGRGPRGRRAPAAVARPPLRHAHRRHGGRGRMTPAPDGTPCWVPDDGGPALSPLPAVTGETGADVTVVGAGLAGLSTAYHLAHRARGCTSPWSMPATPGPAPAAGAPGCSDRAPAPPWTSRSAATARPPRAGCTRRACARWPTSSTCATASGCAEGSAPESNWWPPARPADSSR